MTTAEAATSVYPPPETFDPAPPSLAVGDAIDTESFAQTLLEIGYFADDRVDEPGEMAVRGNVVDLYPADAPTPVRVDIENGGIVAIRTYDAVTQLSTDNLMRVEIGRVNEM